MRKDDHLIFEALQKRLSAEYDHKNKVAKINVTPEEIGKFAGMIKRHVFKKNKQSSENAESKFTQQVSAEISVAKNLMKMDDALHEMSTVIHMSKSSQIDQLLSRIRDTVEMLMSERGSGSEDGEEDIEDTEDAYNKGEEEHYKNKEENAEDSAEDKMRDRENERDERQRDAEVSAAFHYDPMPGLEKTANQIRDILQGAANDEARTEHIIKMAQTILGSPKDYNPQEYRKMLDGLIVLLNKFVVVPMN